MGDATSFYAADPRHLELPYAAQPDRARPRHAARSRSIPYPVVPRTFRAERWWLHAGSIRLLFTEYLKFLPSAARFGGARLLRPWDGHALAGRHPARGPRHLTRQLAAHASLALVRRRLLRQYRRFPGVRQLAAAGAATLGHGRPAFAWARQPVVAEADLRHAARSPRSREIAARRLSGRGQASKRLGYLCPDPGVS